MFFSILSIFTDFNLVLKIFFVLAIITFIRQKVTHNTLALVMIVFAVVALAFFYWPMFGTAYVFYILLTIGVSSILVDVFFVTMGGSGEEAMKAKDNVKIGAEEMAKQRNIQKFMHHKR